MASAETRIGVKSGLTDERLIRVGDQHVAGVGIVIDDQNHIGERHGP
jgi:hypothetical protein